MNRALQLLSAALCLTLVACGGSSPAAPSGSTGSSSSTSGSTSGGAGGGTAPTGTTGGGTAATTGTFTALIDGATFNGALGLTATVASDQLSISGADDRHTLQLVVRLSRGAGTYTFGTIDASNVTTAALALNGTAQNWFAGPGIGGGSITISTLTSTTVAGTFTLTLGPSAGGVTTGTRVVTSGVFNVPLSASSPIPPSVPTGPTTPSGIPQGLAALADGQEWRGSAVAQATRTPQGFVTIAGFDTQNRGISIAILASAPGTYTMTPTGHNALYSAGTQLWFTSQPGGSGSVTISSIDSTRVTGTFTMTLAPGTSNTDRRTVQITSGTFNLPF